MSQDFSDAADCKQRDWFARRGARFRFNLLRARISLAMPTIERSVEAGGIPTGRGTYIPG
jgi:hypothetical protein